MGSSAERAGRAMDTAAIAPVLEQLCDPEAFVAKA
jgi:hypothetical protein